MNPDVTAAAIPPAPAKVVDYLQSPQAIRDRCRQIFHLAQQDQLRHFHLNLGALPDAAAYVLAVMERHYPDGQVPFHSRWRHFEVDGVSRLRLLEPELPSLDPVEQARLKLDLAVTSVLLDAGAGSRWRYVEPETGLVFQRSEGLAIASFHSFVQGLLSSQPGSPWQADAAGLIQLTPEQLGQAFQVNVDNPLLGLEGRVALLQKLGQALQAQPELFGADCPRPGNLVDYWLRQAEGSSAISAATILRTILHGLGPIWPGRVEIAGVNLGDVWPYPNLPDTGLGSQLVPFHKLSQWLTYSLLEPLQDLGLAIADLDQLTGLAEYRNGGLFMDSGVITLKDPTDLDIAHPPSSTLIVEWRALTLCLLDDLAVHLRQTLGQSTTDLPLVKILQGGTWTAGRQIAAEKRPSGGPPIILASDGTVF